MSVKKAVEVTARAPISRHEAHVFVSRRPLSDGQLLSVWQSRGYVRTNVKVLRHANTAVPAHWHGAYRLAPGQPLEALDGLPTLVRFQSKEADVRSASSGDGFACNRLDAGLVGHRRRMAALAAPAAPP